MSVETSDLLQSLAYTNTVNKPVKRKTHHTQFPDTPFVLTMSVTKLGVSVEKVVATIEIPSNHQGIVLPDKKYWEVFFDEVFDTENPITSTSNKKNMIIAESINDNSTTTINW